MRARHLRPILDAVENHGVGFLIAVQGRAPFRLPTDRRPLIMTIGDDLERAVGPSGFDPASLRAVVQRANWAAVIAGAPLPEIYGPAAMVAALLRLDVVLVETQPNQEIPWVQYLQLLRPELGILVGSVVGGNA
jgi:hypothetical protein